MPNLARYYRRCIGTALPVLAPETPGPPTPYRGNSTITPATAISVPVSVRQVMRSAWTREEVSNVSTG